MENTLANKPESPKEGLNTVFGLSESFRNLISAGLLATTAFLAGCAKSIEDRDVAINNLAAPPAATIQENPKWFEGTHVMVRGEPKFITEASISYTDNRPVYQGSGGAIVIPMTTTSTVFIYELMNEGKPSGIILNSKTQLPSEELKISGKVLNQSGKAVIEVEDHVPADFLPSAKAK